MEFEEAAARWLMRRNPKTPFTEGQVDWTHTPKVEFFFSRETPAYSSYTDGDPAVAGMNATVWVVTGPDGDTTPRIVNETFYDDHRVNIPQIVREVSAIAHES